MASRDRACEKYVSLRIIPTIASSTGFSMIAFKNSLSAFCTWESQMAGNFEPEGVEGLLSTVKHSISNRIELTRLLWAFHKEEALSPSGSRLRMESRTLESK